MTLTEFLCARLDEDERHARKLAESDRRPVLSLATTVNHPERLLLEVEAKRRIVNWHAETEDCCEERYGDLVFDANPDLSVGTTALGDLSVRRSIGYQPYLGCITLMHLAAVYSDHPDYDESWRP